MRRPIPLPQERARPEHFDKQAVLVSLVEFSRTVRTIRFARRDAPLADVFPEAPIPPPPRSFV